jgi:hypothetical protein
VGARRDVHHDRHGRPRAHLTWRPDGALAEASVRLPDGAWIRIEPRAGTEAPWGAVDRLWLDATALTALTAVDWAHVTRIPTVVEPSRIPPNGGTAVLNLLATLALEQGVRRLTYDGPYPSETLFLALLECFEPDADDAPLVRFMEGELAWTPAPFTPSFGDDVYVQARERIEKVVWRGRAYYREEWGALRRRAALRVEDERDGLRCGLWALGTRIEDHLLLAPDGAVRAIVAPPITTVPVTPLRPAIRDGVIAMVIALSAPPLAEAIREVAATLRFTCGAVEADLACVEGSEARVSATLAATIARRLAAPVPPSARAPLALAAVAEIARAMGDAVRARAQRRLAAAAPEAQAAALEREAPDATAAPVITAAAADLLASGRVDDEPDVERDEGRDRQD